jgi:hypothetical protein
LRAIGRDDDEFVRPEPRQERSIAGRIQPVADFHQKPVAGRMAIDIVDLLELIDVNAQHRKRGIAGRQLQRVCDALVERSPVRQAGELVVKCQMRDPCLVLRALGDVLVGRNPAAVLRRPVRNIDDAAVVELGDEAVGAARRYHLPQLRSILSEVAIGRARRLARLEHFVERASDAQAVGRQSVHFDVSIVPQQQAIVRPEHAKAVAHMLSAASSFSIVVAASWSGGSPVAWRTPARDRSR